ncbi:MAG TPA: glycosyltransferase family 39 protein [Nitrospira sp.]|nr:glycosyltransferase family 39 protein [Nitrospira sp.]
MIPAVASIFAIAIALRVLGFILLPEPPLPYNALFAYLKGAELLRSGASFGDPFFFFFTATIYSLIFDFVGSVSEASTIGIRIAQMVIDSLTAVLTCLLARELVSARVATFAGIAWALYPFAIYSTQYVGTEVLFAFFLLAFLLYFVWAIKHESRWLDAGAGLCLGLATLTRGTTQFLPLLLPLVLVWFIKDRRRVLRSSGVMLACFVLVVFPWSLRNYLVLHEVIPIGTNSSVILWGSSKPLLTIDSRVKELPQLYDRARAKGIVAAPPDASPSEKDRYFLQLAIENYRQAVRNDPLGLIELLITKFVRLWYSTESGNNETVILLVNLFIYPLALVGAVAVWKERNPFGLLLFGVVIYFALLHWATLPLFRYILPVMPIILCLACLGFDRAFSVTRVVDLLPRRGSL